MGRHRCRQANTTICDLEAKLGALNRMPGHGLRAYHSGRRGAGCAGSRTRWSTASGGSPSVWAAGKSRWLGGQLVHFQPAAKTNTNLANWEPDRLGPQLGPSGWANVN